MRPRATCGGRDVLVSVRSALAIMAVLALTVLMLEIVRHSRARHRVGARRGRDRGARVPGRRVRCAVAAARARRGAARDRRRSARSASSSYRLVNDVTSATDRIQQAAPKRAAELEKNSDLLRQVAPAPARAAPRRRHPEPARGRIGHEGARVGRDARGRVRGRARSSRSSSSLYGPRIFAAGSRQIRDPRRRARVEQVLVRGDASAGSTTRASRCSRRSSEGVLAYVIARAAGVPGPAALGVWVGLWTLLPVAGVFVGALPIVLFAGASSLTRAVVVGARVRRDRHRRVPLHAGRRARDRRGRVVPRSCSRRSAAWSSTASPARCSASSA